MTSNRPGETGYVLDSHAILTYLGAETGCDRVAQFLEMAVKGVCKLHMCVVNLGEVIYIEERERGLAHAKDVLARIDDLPIEIINPDRPLTLAAAHLKAEFPIAYADCFAAALAKARNAVLITGDPEFQKLKPECGVRVEWLDNHSG